MYLQLKCQSQKQNKQNKKQKGKIFLVIKKYFQYPHVQATAHLQIPHVRVAQGVPQTLRLNLFAVAYSVLSDLLHDKKESKCILLIKFLACL